MDKMLRVALLGCGTVGEEAAKIVYEQGPRYGLVLSGIAVGNPGKERGLYRQHPSLRDRVVGPDKAYELIGNADIVVELVGYRPEALAYICAALEGGKDVVTGNKEHLAQRTNPSGSPDLFALGRRHRADIAYEAAVAGGIPIVRRMREGFAPYPVGTYSILNGTTHFMLTMMTKGASAESALAEAQRLGYAEADPSTDVDGIDPACKLSLLTALNRGAYVDPRKLPRTGIRGIRREDCSEAGAHGYAVKLVAYDRLSDNRIEARVTPALVPYTHELAGAEGRDNMVVVDAGRYGHYSFKGPGAGGEPTAVSVWNDLKHVAGNRRKGTADALPVFDGELSLASLASLAKPLEAAYLLDGGIVVPGAIEPGWVERALKEAKQSLIDSKQSLIDFLSMTEFW